MPIKARNFIPQFLDSPFPEVLQEQTAKAENSQGRLLIWSRDQTRLCGLTGPSEVAPLLLLLLATPLFLSLWLGLPPLHQRVYALLVIPQAASPRSNIRLSPNQDNGIKPRRWRWLARRGSESGRDYGACVKGLSEPSSGRAAS